MIMRIARKGAAFLLAFCIVLTGLLGELPGIAGDTIDESNHTSGPNADSGTAQKGNAYYLGTGNDTMWKITVYVAKKDTTGVDEGTTLTKDYYKFGETFWIYRDDCVISNSSEAEYKIDTGRLYVATQCKEDYVNGKSSFVQKKYAEVSGRFFSNKYFGSNDIIPFPAGISGSNYDNDSVDSFFVSNYNTSNTFIQLAVKAKYGNIVKYTSASDTSAVDKAVKNELSAMTFTINGETKKGFDNSLTDARVEYVNNSYSDITCNVAWVFTYEPVLIINATGKTGYYHAFTASDMAKASLTGKYIFTSSEHDYLARFGDSSDIPSTYSKVSWNLGTHLPCINMPNSMNVEQNWLGYKNYGYYSEKHGGTSSFTWTWEEMLYGGGIGMRYLVATTPKVVIKKTVNGQSAGKQLSGFTFTLSGNGFNVSGVTDVNGECVFYLPSGSYTLKETDKEGYAATSERTVTVPTGLKQGEVFRVDFNNTTIGTGTLVISKVAEDNNYEDTYFVVESEDGKISLKVEADGKSGTAFTYNGAYVDDSAEADPNILKIVYKYEDTVCSDGAPCSRIWLYNLPEGNYNVTEIRPDRYDNTFSKDAVSQDGLCFKTTVTKNKSSFLRIDNELGTSDLTIIKVSEDRLYDNTKFSISGNTALGNEINIEFYADGDNFKTQIEYGTIIKDVEILYEDVVISGALSKKITIKNLPVPEITYTVSENERPYRYASTSIKKGNIIISGTNTEVDLKENSELMFFNICGRTVTVNLYDKYTDKLLQSKILVNQGDPETDYYNSQSNTYDVTKVIEALCGETGLNLLNLSNDGIYSFSESVTGDSFIGILDKNKVINIYYGYNNRISVEYYDAYTKEKISEDYIEEKEHLSAYDVTSEVSKSIPGYTIIKNISGDSSNGTLNVNKNIKVYLGYENTLQLRYIDKYTDEIVAVESISQEHNSAYDVTARISVPNNYEFIDSAQGDEFAGNFAGDKFIDIYVGYTNTLTVEFFDKYSGDFVKLTTVSTREHNSDYSVKELIDEIPEGYDFAAYTEGDPDSGILDSDKLIMVYYGYNHTVTIKYFDKYTTGEILECYTETEEHNSAYNISDKVPDSISKEDITYSYDSLYGGTLEGVLTGDVTIDVYYGYENTVTVNYIDKYSGLSIMEAGKISQEHNTQYDAADFIDKTVEGYEAIDRIEGNPKGTLDENKVIDVYYGYSKNIVVRYLEKGTGNCLNEAFSEKVEYLNNYDESIQTAKEIKNYKKCEVTGDAEAGITDGDKEIIVWYERIQKENNVETGDKGRICIIISLLAMGFTAISLIIYEGVKKHGREC